MFCGESFISTIPSNDMDSDATLISDFNTNKQVNSIKTRVSLPPTAKPKTANDKDNYAQSSCVSASVASSSYHQSQHIVNHQSLFSSMLGNSHSNGLVPVILLPYDQVLPMIQPGLYNDSKRISDSSKHDSLHSNHIDMWNQQQKSSMSSIMSHHHYQDRDFIPQRHSHPNIPNVEVDRQLIDFGVIAEGTYNMRNIVLKCLDRYVDPNQSLLVELHIANVNTLPNLKHHENDLKMKFKSVFSLTTSSLVKRTELPCNQELRIDFNKNPLNDVFVHMNTVNLNLYTDLLKDHRHPIDVTACLSVSCLMNSRKIVLKKIDVPFFYGNARLKTSSDFESVGFVINKKIIKTGETEDIIYTVDSDVKSIPLWNGGMRMKVFSFFASLNGVF